MTNYNKESLIFGKWKVGDEVGFDTRDFRYHCTHWSNSDKTNHRELHANRTDSIVLGIEIHNNEEHLLFARDEEGSTKFAIPKSELINKGIIKEDNKMNKEFTVEGNKYLLIAFLDELKTLDIRCSNYDVESILSTDPEFKLLPHNRGNNIEVWWTCLDKKLTHYILPGDYNRAKQAFLDLIPKKPTEVKLTITTDNGDHELLITKEYVEYEGYSMSIEEVRSLKTRLTWNGCAPTIKTILKADLGCKGQIEGINASHLTSILNKHSEIE